MLKKEACKLKNSSTILYNNLPRGKMEKESPELAELEDTMKRNNLEFMCRDSDSAESVESAYSNVPESKKRPHLNNVELNRNIEKDFLELEDRILRGTFELEEALDDMELKKRNESEFLKFEDRNSKSRHKEVKILNRQEIEKVPLVSQDIHLGKALELEETPEKIQKPETSILQESDSVFKRIEDEISYTEASEKFMLESQDKIVRETLELEDSPLKRRALGKFEEGNPVAGRNSSHEVDDRQVEVQIPLMKEESVSIDLRDASDSSKDQVQVDTKDKTDLKKLFRSLSLVGKSASQTSVLQQIRNAKESSKSKCDCCKKTFIIIGSLFLYIVYIAVLSIVPIAMIVVGSMHFDDCPVQPHIPIYLVVTGVFGILNNFKISRERFCSKSTSYTCFDGFMNLFLLIWFILGCVWVYGTSHVEYYATSDSAYCHKSVYLFAFWLLNLVFILLGATAGLLCCAAMCCAVDR